MPLKDHFSPNSDVWCQWHSFQVQWAGGIIGHLNLNVLDQDHTAGYRIHSQHPEVDPLAFEPLMVDARFPPPTAREFGQFIEPSANDVTVRSRVYERTAAVVTLVGTEFTDSLLAQRQFAVKIANRLQNGTSAVVVNMVAEQAVNLHRPLCQLIGLSSASEDTVSDGPSATVYRPVRAGTGERLEIWTYPLTVGNELPTVPLWLAADLAVPLELELPYAAACKSLRLG